jgi:hypothetical protein
MKYIVTIAAVLIVTLPLVALAQEPVNSPSGDKESVEAMPGTNNYQHDHRKMKGLPSSTNSKTTDQTEDSEQKENSKKHDHRKEHKHQ